jgi:hypothetical protein
MKHLLLFFFFVCALTNISTAQKAPEYLIRCPRPYEADFDSSLLVLARSGLKLREKPAFDAKTLALMPFAQKVKLLEMPRFDETGDLVAVYTPDSIPGAWLKVRYGKKTGYAFSAWLGSSIVKMSKPYYLLSAEGSWCVDDSYISDRYRYYGIFRDQNGACTRQEIKPEFWVRWTSMYGPGAYCKLRVRGEKPLFVLASQKELPEGPVAGTGRHGYLPGNNMGELSTLTSIPESPWEFSIRYVARENSDALVPQAIAKSRQSGMIYRLGEAANWYDTPQFLLWEGDADGDGALDFILTVQREITATWQLFLGGEPIPGFIIRVASQYTFSGCC